MNCDKCHLPMRDVTTQETATWGEAEFYCEPCNHYQNGELQTMKPLIERITQGPVTSETITHFNQEQTILLASGREVARILGGVHGTMLPESLADAEFIAEAFTVAHETGMTPRQMAERITQADEALKLLQGFITDLGDSNPGFLGKLCLQDYGRVNEAYIAMDRYVAQIPPAKP